MAEITEAGVTGIEAIGGLDFLFTLMLIQRVEPIVSSWVL